MFEEVKKAIGANWFRALVVAFGCLWVVHTFSGTILEFFQAKNVAPQAENADVREKAIAKGAVADAVNKEAIARMALDRQKSEADLARAKACTAQMQQMTENLRPGDVSSDGSLKPFTSASRAYDAYRKNCDPRFNECYVTYLNLLLEAPHLSEAEFKPKLLNHAANCPITDDQRTLAANLAEQMKRKLQ